MIARIKKIRSVGFLLSEWRLFRGWTDIDCFIDQESAERYIFDISSNNFIKYEL